MSAPRAQRLEKLSVDETAALWRVRLSRADVSAEQRTELDRWLAASAEHRAAYGAMDRAWSVAGEEASDPDVRAMREAALRFQAPARRWSMPKGQAIAAVLAVAAVGATLWAMRDRFLTNNSHALAARNVTHGQFQTAVGERATIRLGDGSTVTLNTASRVQLDLTRERREVKLQDGQAIFEVARDRSRPFVVLAADRRITALGTSFDVRVESSQVRVTLVEGKVAIDQAAAAAAALGATSEEPLPAIRTRLEPGEQFVAPIGGTAKVQGANVERITSWREGRLIFEADRLADALAEMNRYSALPIELDDPAIGELRVSGVFRTGQPAAFAHALEQYFPVQSRRQQHATVLSWRR